MDTDPEAWNLRKAFVLERNGLVVQILHLKANLIYGAFMEAEVKSSDLLARHHCSNKSEIGCSSNWFTFYFNRGSKTFKHPPPF